MKPEISIIFGHYSEDAARDSIALRCLSTIQQFRNKNTEIIVSCNGHYGDSWKLLADKWIERDADIQPGRTINRGITVSEGRIYFIMSNDILLYPGAVEQSAAIVRGYQKYLSTPIYPVKRQWHEKDPIDGYNVNSRLGSNCLCMRKDQYLDIGPFDEVLINFDMVNYINRWIRKGYAVAMTKDILAKDLGLNVHSYKKQEEQYRFKKWGSRKTIFHPEKLKVEDLYEI